MKKKELSLIPQNTGIMESLLGGHKLTLEQEVKIKANLPTWIPEKERLGTSVLQTSTEFLLLLEQILQKEYGFSEKNIEKLEKKIKQILPVLHEMEIERNLSILSPKDMEIIGDIAEKRYDRLDKVDKHFFLGARKKQLRLKGGKK